MKFGKTLLRVQVPEWSRNYISYKELKQVIKKLKDDRKDNPSLTAEDTFTEFSYALDRELEKVNGFYLYKRAEMERRMVILNEKYRQILVNDGPASSSEEQENATGFNDPEEDSELLSSLVETRNHMHKILRFGEVNKQGFFKILKKFDKQLSMDIKSSYLKTKVEILPFACSPVLSDMLDKINDLITQMKLRNDKNQAKPSDEIGKRIKSLISIDTEAELKKALQENNGSRLLEILDQIKQNSSVKQYGEDSYQYKKMATKLLYKICQLKAFDCLRIILEKGLFDIESTKDVNERSLIHKLVIGGGVLKSKEEAAFPDSPNKKPQQDYFSLLKASSSGSRSPLLPPNTPSSPKPVYSEDDPTLLSIIFEYLPKETLYKNPDIFGRHPLHYAALNGYTRITECLVKYLLETELFTVGNGFGDDLWYDHEGFNPLFYAAINGHAEIVRILIEGGHYKCTVADAIAATVPSISSDHVFGSGIVQAHLPTKPANNIYLQNPLAIACKLGHDNVVEVLLQHDIDVNLADEDGETPLHLAARDGYSNCVKLLVEFGCTSTNNPAELKFARRKINLDARERFNEWTPLFLAAIEGHLKVIELLVKAGADISAKDVNDWTPHEHAVYRGHHEAAKLLQTNTDDPPTATVPSEILTKPTPESSGDSRTETVIQVDRAYGHKFLQNQSVIVITLGTNDTRITVPPVELENSDISLISMVPSTSLSLVISATHANGEPAYVDLPVRTLAVDPIMFYTESVDDVVLKFDVVPTYGSSKKIVGRATASVRSLRSTSTRNRSSLGGSVTVPIVGSDNLDVIGSVYFDFTIVKPFVHKNLVVGSQNTYWKSITTKVIGHRGLGANKKVAGQGHLQVGENTVLSFVTAASLGAEYIEFDVQLTRDHVPVIYHDWTITETGFDVPVNAITLKQFRGLRPDNTGLQFASERSASPEKRDRFREMRHRGRSKSFHIPRSPASDDEYGSIFSATAEKMKGNGFGTIQAPFATLEEVFKHVPNFIGFNIEVKYPMIDEVEGDMLWSNCDINEFVDHVLTCVYDNVGDRNIIFSSFHPDICLLLSLKQPNYPVFFLTDAGVTRMADARCNSIEDAVRFAKYAGLLGIVTISEPILEAPKLIRTIKETGLLLFTYGSLNNDVVHVQRQKKYGVDAVIVDSVLAVRKSLSQA